eukprot:TRINITY_DN32511_c0_g1_i1.p1 TRINITY_DN32511_c0_g1~~TRINITY_DN32511_c0_g1_i1.p1  ORF type:complete len:909 (-),score=101.84 TRINITY_DN32511_c0_g1_i1:58-2736(-)
MVKASNGGTAAAKSMGNARLTLVKCDDSRVLDPRLLGGYIAAHAPTFSCGGARLFVPCGNTALCYSVKTLRRLGALAQHTGEVTAVCASPSSLPDGTEPLASASSSGEVRVWDSKTLACLGSLSLDAPVMKLCWLRGDALLAVLKAEGDAREVMRIDVSTVAAPRAVGLTPLRAAKAGAFDTYADAAALTDGKDLCVWVDGWPGCCRFEHEQPLTSVTVDPMRRYVAAGDTQGVIWTWWGVLDAYAPSTRRVPARFHWHANPVRALAHCGPIVLSGGNEAVLCYRRSDTDAPQFIPRFPGPISHIATSSDGAHICLSLADNSLALVEDLHGWVRPRWIQAVAVPVDGVCGETLGACRHRATGLRRPVLHALPQSSIAVSANGQRVQFLENDGSVATSRTLPIRKTNFARAPGNKKTEQRWQLWQLAFSSDASCLMTCERRLSPAMHRFDSEGAESYVVKWWRRDADSDQYVLDSMVNNPHAGEVTVCLSHPQREHFFVSCSLDGEFKCWDWLGAGKSDEGRCWQCVSICNWHSRPILSGCFCMDGSVLALGFHGFVVLWDPQEAAEVQTIALGDAEDQANQLAFSMVNGRLVLVVGTRAAEKSREDVTCYDLLSLEVVARLDLASILPGVGPAALRVAELPSNSSGMDALSMMVFREEVPRKDKNKSKAELQVWSLTPKDGSFEFVKSASGRIPSERTVLDATLVGTEQPRVICWMSDFEMMDIDLSKDGSAVTELMAEEADADAEEGVDVRSKALRLVGGRSTAEGAGAASGVGAFRRLLAPVLRTTPVQQAGVLPQFLENVLPAHVPSHLLPPPDVLQARVLSVFAKMSDDALVQQNGQTPSAQNVQDSAEGSIGAENGVKAPGSRLESTFHSETVDAAWMDALVQEVAC